MKYIVTLNGKRYEVEVEQGQATAVYTGEAKEIPGPVKEPLVKEAAKPAEPAPAAADPGDGEALNSPMPGMIRQVKVSAGQAVHRGDALFILEAMKLESEIEAERDGTVTFVAVKKGERVQAGQLLARIR